MNRVNNLKILHRMAASIPLRMKYTTNAADTATASTTTKILRPRIGNKFPGAKASFTLKPDITYSSSYESIPIYRVLDHNGDIIDQTQDPQITHEFAQKLFRDMVLLSVMDKILYESQRQGRISFYMTNTGEEASHVGSAAGLDNEDLIYAQYREAGILVWRGFTISEFIDQCYGNVDDEGKGRQMPVHYGSKKLNFVTISSPLATQIPQAVGAAYAFKLRPDNQQCVAVYFGEGAASEGDTHAAFNFASTLDCPVIFFCRNNGFAISTPSTEQYRGDGIAGRAAGYGIATIRADGTDALAIYNATKIARKFVIEQNKPIVFEAMSYRIGHHSTSDDSTAYRSNDELEVWNTIEHPLSKMKKYIKNKGWWNDDEENEYVRQIRKQILSQITLSEKKLKPDWREMFHDVYYDMPTHLKEQMAEMEKHIQKHKNYYPLDKYKNDV